MKDLKTVYRYRYDTKNGVWEKKQIENVMVSGTLDAYTLGSTQNRDAHLTLRVMSLKWPDVLPEDVIAFFDEDGEKPPKKHAVVVSVTQNLRGTKHLRHTKILCR